MCWAAVKGCQSQHPLNVTLFIPHLLLRVAAFKAGILLPAGLELLLRMDGILLTWSGQWPRVVEHGLPTSEHLQIFGIGRFYGSFGG